MMYILALRHAFVAATGRCLLLAEVRLGSPQAACQAMCEPSQDNTMHLDGQSDGQIDGQLGRLGRQ